MATTWINRGHLYAPHVTPVIADCRFTVTPTNGLGITALKGQAVQNVFMHTSTTPSAGPNGLVNPNPAAGIIMVQLADNYTQIYGCDATISSPNSGTPILVIASGAALSVGSLYVITLLGTSTAADWIALGVPRGVTPAIGVAFVALATGAGTGSGAVQAPATAGSAIDHVELVGSPTTMLGPVPVGGSPNVGAWIMLRAMAKTVSGTAAAQILTMASYTPAGTNNGASPPIFAGTPAVLTGTNAASAITATSVNAQTAPATGSIIRLCLYLNQSSVQIAGE